jgi:two-component system sensor histidine kinase CpxA
MHDRQSGGAGLDLAITARAVELHSGQVRAFNAQDGGVIVEVRLLVQSA